MTRHADWERLLGEYVASMSTVVFNHGTNDCALFAAGAVLAMTGSDPAKAFRGRYRSQAGAVRALRQIGDGDLESTIDGMFERKPSAFAQRGDLIWNGEAVGVCAGGFAWFVGVDPEKEGLVRIPRADWQGAWSV